ncbi:hypothetical protein CO038_00730 [Candidatus Pacearchaeota archaeon CG_4_9_14_0_2_um_filter_39_13]|nr:hypothetical protein [Candidatus Pacearchaeota archaeon]OIO43729.1 MAG: hypothetical protein AUJ64_01805 [Candidatus Pacearchaeota archaeon CG1_02_39_14]PJC45031.1 MAG: hypothetical protein CO038_00730 [Candidatus Pacearchaeota archaeon CG_4_9_14_0_2_um_filter_39_13]
MRARWIGGPDITLNLEDREQGNRTETLEARMPEWKKPVVRMHIVDYIEKTIPFEEPGFHIDTVPKDASPENIERYDIYLSREVWKSLTNPTGNPIVEGGYFVSRCLFDRTEIKFFAV